MPKNRQTYHDPLGEFPPVTDEILENDLMRFTEIGAAGRANVVTFAGCFAIDRRAAPLTVSTDER
ncbi:hypothetical protein NED98_08170 [Sphingomonas sp. MMSM20]|uniref:hypothetical protein n=1 Tax=Sphingomonas lycopersici TaxID=2951807 RepID=UPI0022389F33|nr:hypothetical protein [Sphingomonas lycopersici]MCW6530219.1 hypothetical protein [Sphingomonas lycopersici]